MDVCYCIEKNIHSSLVVILGSMTFKSAVMTEQPQHLRAGGGMTDYT